MKRIKVVDSALREKCRKEGASSIRLLLDIHYENALTNLVKTLDDHRYRQGYLQALEDIIGTIDNQ